MKTSSVIYTNLDEILFEDRNKSYGSYQLRQKDGQNTMLALVLTTATAVVLLLLLYYFRPAIKAVADTGVVTFTEVNLPANTFTVPEPPEPKTADAAPAQPKGMDTQASGDIKPVNDRPDLLTSTIAPDSAFQDKQPGSTTTDTGSDKGTTGSPTGCKECPPQDKPTTGTGTGTEIIEPKPYEVFLGEMPTPLNLDDVRRALVYPADLKAARLDGKVSYRVLVDENGQYVRHELIRASHPLFDKQCAPQLHKLRFTPGKMGEHKVKVWVTVPFRFELQR